MPAAPRATTECLPYDQTRAHRMGYLWAHADARRRLGAGERQTLCPSCGQYYWARDSKEHRQPVTPAR